MWKGKLMALLSVSKDFVVKHGLVVNTTATFLSTVNATSTNSGAVIVAGGVGIAKDLYVGGTIFGAVEGAAFEGIASTATNLNNGTAGQLPYQVSPGITGFVGPGTSGQVLVSNGTSTPSYTSNLILGAVTATSLFVNTWPVSTATVIPTDAWQLTFSDENKHIKSDVFITVQEPKNEMHSVAGYGDVGMNVQFSGTNLILNPHLDEPDPLHPGAPLAGTAGIYFTRPETGASFGEDQNLKALNPTRRAAYIKYISENDGDEYSGVLVLSPWYQGEYGYGGPSSIKIDNDYSNRESDKTTTLIRFQDYITTITAPSGYLGDVNVPSPYQTSQVNINGSSGHQALTIAGSLDFSQGAALAGQYTSDVPEFSPGANMGYSYLVLPALHTSSGDRWIGQISANPKRIREDHGANYEDADGIPFFSLGSKMSTQLEELYPSGGIAQYERIPDNHTISWDVRGRVSVNEATLDESLNVLGSIKIQVSSTANNYNGVVNSNYRTGRPQTGDEANVGIYFADGTFQYTAFNESSISSTATNAYTVLVAPTSDNATYYPTIVNAISTSSAYEYTTSSFSINPFTGEVVLASTTGTSSPQTGALVVYGGVGIGENLHVGGLIETDGIRSSGTVTLSGVGLVEPRYTVKIDSGGPGAKLAIRTSADPDYGIFTAVLDNNDISGASYRVGASEFKVGIIDDTTGVTVGSSWAFEITTASNVKVNSNQDAISTTTGALTVQGGVGIGGNLYVGGNFYAAGVPVLTTTTLATSFNGGTDILIDISTSTGILTINDIATLQTVTDRGATTNNQISINNTSISTTIVSGALTVAGGVGVDGNVNSTGLFAHFNGELGLHDQYSPNYVGFKSSTTLATTTVWTLPAQDGQAGQFLATDGAQTLSWQDPVDSVYPPFPTGDYALDEAYPGEVVLVDAFGVSLQESFSCMNPEGVMLYEDLGVLT